MAVDVLQDLELDQETDDDNYYEPWGAQNKLPEMRAFLACFYTVSR